jgi:exosortase D (VPLPA-CTERM-specific)
MFGYTVIRFDLMSTVQNSIHRVALTPLWGLFWLALACAGAGIFFLDGLDALMAAWQQPEYSHGPLIPVLSLLLFLRQLKEYPSQPGPKDDRWIGVALILLSVAMATVGKLAGISDVVTYSTIFWVGGILLVSFGWKTGRHFWPPVVHLIYMLPLPAVLYYKMSSYLQIVSSELGVWFLQMANVPVFLDGNIIDLGVLKLHVAEACSGLRYLFPILSFSYIFAVLYKGPMWHKAVLLISAAPITIFMNSVRIAVGGVLVQHYGVEWLEGFSHFFEGWVIFLICILLLFVLARVMLFFQSTKMSLIDALDLDTDGLVPQMKRILLVEPSRAMIASATIMIIAVFSWQFLPERDVQQHDRDPFSLFPSTLGDWSQHGPDQILEQNIIAQLQADDYHQAVFVQPETDIHVGLFTAWYADQSKGGIHSPEICLPGAGWEIAWLERVDIAQELGVQGTFNINKAIIQRGETRMMVYYWFEQKGRKVAWDFGAKLYLLWDGMTTGRKDGAIVRLTTLIGPDETDDDAQARLNDMLGNTVPVLPRFIPGL